MEKKIRELQDECEAGRASAAAAARVYQDKKEAWGAEIDYLKDQSLQLQRKLDQQQQQQQQQQRPPENNDVSKEVLLALQDATTALAATRRNLAASALQVASLKAELKQEKRLRRRAQGLADELADRVLSAHRSGATKKTGAAQQRSPPPVAAPAPPPLHFASSARATVPSPARGNDPSEAPAERSVRFEEFASITEFSPGSRVCPRAAAPSSPTPEAATESHPGASADSAGAAPRRRAAEEPVTPARESLARPQTATAKHEAYRSIRTPKAKGRHRVRLALELGCLAGKGSAELRAAALRALSTIEEANHRRLLDCAHLRSTPNP